MDINDLPFRLLDLPGEIRNRIYYFALCTFFPPQPIVINAHTGICPVEHNIETTILRTCKQVHREAYDVMIKGNHFIRVQTTDVPISQLIVPTQIPIVTMDREKAAQFKGHVLFMRMEAVPGGWAEEPIDHGDEEDSDADEEDDADMDDFEAANHALPVGRGPFFDFMILGRDWDSFCHMIARADTVMDKFSTSVKISLTLNPFVKPQSESESESATPCTLPDYKASLEEYFTPRTLDTLLYPFRSQLRDFEHVEIKGTIPPDLAATVVKEVKQSQWTDPDKMLEDLQSAKDRGTAFYQAKEYLDASTTWTGTAADVRRVRFSSSWTSLTTRGGTLFLNRVSELYFTLLLNSAQCSLKAMQTAPISQSKNYNIGNMVTGLLQEAFGVSHEFYHAGATWHPSEAQMAKLQYRQALCWRLMDDPRDLDDAVEWIARADELQPGDPVIEQEKRRIDEWERRVDEELMRDEVYQEYLAGLM